MTQSEWFNFLDLLNPVEVAHKIANKAKDLFNKESLNKIIKTADVARKLFPHPKKMFSLPTLGIISFPTLSFLTVTNNEIKHFMKLIKSLKNREILLTGTTAKITVQEGGFLNFLRPLRTAALLLMKNALTPLAKSVLIPLGLKAAAWATDAAIQKKIYRSGTTALIISNEEMKHIMKIVKSLEENVYSRNNWSKTKDGEYIINLVEYEKIGTHWIVLYVNTKTTLIILELEISQRKFMVN